MRIVAEYNFNNGLSIKNRFPLLFSEILESVEHIDAEAAHNKISEEKTMPGKMLYSPAELNRRFKERLSPRG